MLTHYNGKYNSELLETKFNNTKILCNLANNLDEKMETAPNVTMHIVPNQLTQLR